MTEKPETDKPETKPEAKGRTAKVGTKISVKQDGTVIRPDGTTHRIRGGHFIFDAPGVFLVDGVEHTVKG